MNLRGFGRFGSFLLRLNNQIIVSMYTHVLNVKILMNSDENTQVESVAACSLVCGNQKHLIVIYF